MITRLISEWSRAFKAPMNNTPTVKDESLPTALRLVDEELSELKEAIGLEDLKQVRKEFCDLLWVVIRLGMVLGVNIFQDLTAVYDSNMSKLGQKEADAPDEYHEKVKTDYGDIYLREDGKVLKPKNYRPAILVSLLILFLTPLFGQLRPFAENQMVLTLDQQSADIYPIIPTLGLTYDETIYLSHSYGFPVLEDPVHYTEFALQATPLNENIGNVDLKIAAIIAVQYEWEEKIEDIRAGLETHILPDDKWRIITGVSVLPHHISLGKGIWNYLKIRYIL